MQGNALSKAGYLLSVLPALDANLIPEPLRCLMTDQDSPIADLYKNSRVTLKYHIDREGAWSEADSKILLDSYDFCQVRKMLDAFYIHIHEIYPSLAKWEKPSKIIIYYHKDGLLLLNIFKIIKIN